MTSYHQILRTVIKTLEMHLNSKRCDTPLDIIPSLPAVTVRAWSYWREEERFFLGIIRFMLCQAYKMYVEMFNGFTFVNRLIY
jgi:hypothetical protein